MKVLTKHRSITKAAKIDPHASDSPGEAQGGGRGPACQAVPPRLSREVGPRIPGAECPATGTRQRPPLITPPRASTPALCVPRRPSVGKTLQGGGRVGCVHLSGPASPGSDLAASSFLMASGSGEGQCKARGLGRRLGAGLVMAETRNGGSTCSGTSSHPQSPPTGPPQVPTTHPPAVDREAIAECKRRGSGGSRKCAHGQGPPTPWQRQNSRAFFLRSFLFQRARRSNSSTLIPNTSWNSSGDRCLSSLVRSTSLGSFTRIRFVTIRASYG